MAQYRDCWQSAQLLSDMLNDCTASEVVFDIGCDAGLDQTVYNGPVLSVSSNCVATANALGGLVGSMRGPGFSDGLIGCSLGRWLYAVDDCFGLADSFNIMLETWISTGGSQCVLTTPTTTTATTTDYMPGFTAVITSTFTSITGGWKDVYWLITALRQYACRSIMGETRINVAQLGTFTFPVAAEERGVGGCGGTLLGCCNDGSTAKADAEGSNCPGKSMWCFGTGIDIDLSTVEFPGPVTLIISTGTLDCAGVAIILAAMLAEVVGPSFPVPEIGCGLAGQFVLYSWGGGEVVIEIFIHWLNFIVDCFQRQGPDGDLMQCFGTTQTSTATTSPTTSTTPTTTTTATTTPTSTTSTTTSRTTVTRTSTTQTFTTTTTTTETATSTTTTTTVETIGVCSEVTVRKVCTQDEPYATMCVWKNNQCNFKELFCTMAVTVETCNRIGSVYAAHCEWDVDVSYCRFRRPTCTMATDQLMCDTVDPFRALCDWSVFNNTESCRHKPPEQCPALQYPIVPGARVCSVCPHRRDAIDVTMVYGWLIGLTYGYAFPDWYMSGRVQWDHPLRTITMSYTGANCDPYSTYCSFQEGFTEKDFSTVIGDPMGASAVNADVFGDGRPLGSFYRVQRCQPFGNHLDMRGVSDVSVQFSAIGSGALVSQVTFKLACAVGVSYGDQYGPVRIEGFTFVDGRNDEVCDSVVNPTTTLSTTTTTFTATTVTATVPTTTSTTTDPVTTTTFWNPQRPPECSVCDRDTRGGKHLKLTSIMLRYVRNRSGGDRNVQPNGKWGSTFPDDLRFPYNARVVLPDKGEVLPVVPDVAFTVSATNGHKLPPELVMTLKSEGSGTGNSRETLGEVWLHTSCSHPIRLGDRFGPFEIVGFESTSGEVPNLDDIDACIFAPPQRQAAVVGGGSGPSSTSSGPLVGVGATLIVSLATLGVAMYYYRVEQAKRLEYDGTIETASTQSTTQYSPSLATIKTYKT